MIYFQTNVKAQRVVSSRWIVRFERSSEHPLNPSTLSSPSHGHSAICTYSSFIHTYSIDRTGSISISPPWLVSYPISIISPRTILSSEPTNLSTLLDPVLLSVAQTPSHRLTYFTHILSDWSQHTFARFLDPFLLEKRSSLRSPHSPQSHSQPVAPNRVFTVSFRNFCNHTNLRLSLIVMDTMRILPPLHRERSTPSNDPSSAVKPPQITFIYWRFVFTCLFAMSKR